MEILLLSAYDAPSHRQWHTGLVNSLKQHQWTVLTLPARQFSWRFRSNALHWHLQNEAQLSQRFDLIIATSMVDLAGLRGLRPELAALPSVLYFHENQFAYPVSDDQHSAVELQLSSIISALSADRLVFNSNYNRATFLDGIEQFLKSMPDKLAQPAVDMARKRCTVLPVPLEDIDVRRSADGESFQRPVEIVWNHRWEYDKGPDRLLAFAQQLLSEGVAARLHVIGQQFRQQPEQFSALAELLQASAERGGSLQAGQWGFIDNEASYRALLQRCDVVLSTAIHDFQGLSVLEAVQHGCIPLVPNRLVYSEWFATDYCYTSATGDIQREATAAVATLAGWLQAPPSLPDLDALRWSELAVQYESLIQQAVCSA